MRSTARCGSVVFYHIRLFIPRECTCENWRFKCAICTQFVRNIVHRKTYKKLIETYTHNYLLPLQSVLLALRYLTFTSDIVGNIR